MPEEVLLGLSRVCMIPSFSCMKPGVLAEESINFHRTSELVPMFLCFYRDQDAPRIWVCARRRRRCVQSRQLRRVVPPRSRRALDPPFDCRRYACELHTSLHAALAPTSRASQQPCRATPKPALMKPARPSSHHAPCSSRRGRSCRRAHSPRSIASSWTAWYGSSENTRAGAGGLTTAAHDSRLPQGQDQL